MKSLRYLFSLSCLLLLFTRCQPEEEMVEQNLLGKYKVTLSVVNDEGDTFLVKENTLITQLKDGTMTFKLLGEPLFMQNVQSNGEELDFMLHHTEKSDGQKITELKGNAAREKNGRYYHGFYNARTKQLELKATLYYKSLEETLHITAKGKKK